MALMNIAQGNVDRRALGENVNVSCYLPEKVVELAEEFAREFNVSRSYVLREMMVSGYLRALDQWELAHEQGKRRKGK